MALSKKSTVKILSSLDEEPKLRFFPWEIDVRNAAAAMCRTITPRGLLSVTLSDAQWAAYPANVSVDPQGQIVIAARFVPPVHIEVLGTMTSPELFVAKTSNDQLLEWITAEEALKQAIVESLGPVVRQIMKDPAEGFTLMSIRTIMDKVRAKFGRMRSNTKTNLEEKLNARLPSTDAFDTHISTMRENFNTSVVGGHPIQEYDRVEYLRKSVAGHVLIDQTLRQFDFQHPDESQHRFEDIVSYIEDHLPNLQSANNIAAQATAHIMTSEAYLTLEAEVKSLKAAAQDQKKRSGGKGKGKNGKQKKQRQNRTRGDKSGKGEKGGDPAKDDKPLKYCHAHGSQRTHTSSECKLMAADTARFTKAMRQAKDSNQPPGGSTKVLGQQLE